jgi:hypothetical protein
MSGEYQSLDAERDLEQNIDASGKPDDGFCTTYEYCGPYCGHEFHWTEALFTFILGTSVLMTILVFTGVGVPGIVFSGALLLFSLLALKLLWGYLATKSLAKLAFELRNYAADFKASTKAHMENAETLQKENKQLQTSLEEFKKSAGMLDSHATDVSAVEKKLFDLFDRHQKLLEEQAQFDREHERFLKMQEEYRVVLKLEATKDRLRDQFSYADINRDGIVHGDKELSKLKQYVEEAGLKFPPKLDDKNKKIKIWEFMDALNTVAPTPVLQLNEIQKEIKKLSERMKKAQKGFNKAAKKHKASGSISIAVGVTTQSPRGTHPQSAGSDDEEDEDEKETKESKSDARQALLSGK